MTKLLLTLCLALITSIGASAQGSSYNGQVVADEGAWCWFADPRALHYENESGTINATYIGYIDYHGSIKATQVDFNTGTTSEVLIRSWFQPDDHDNPAFLVLPDERIMIIYSRHTDEACFYYRISKRPGDITCLGEEKRLATANNTTYPNPYILSDDPDHIYMCWRGIGWHPTVAQMSMPDANDDIKFTWGPYQMVQSTGARPYAKYISNGKDKIYLAYTTGHPDNEYPNWLYCNAFDINDKCLYDLNGKKLSSVATGKWNVNKTDSYKSAYPATVVDATSDRRDWIWNMAFDTKGNPVIGMTKISNDKRTHDYYYAKWNGSKWNVSFVANGGGQFHHTNGVEMCYSSGMAIDRDNPNIVYCGVPVDGAYGTMHEIWRYTLDANGKVTSSEAVTRNSQTSNARPFVIEGTQNSPLRLTWMYGDYYYWIVNTTYRKAYPTSIMSEYILPSNMPSAPGSSLSVDMQIDAANYKGDLLTAGDITYGVNSNQYSYIKIAGKTFTSQNVLGTADSWQTENTATTGGVWFSKTPLGKYNLTLTYDSSLSRLTVYVNGIIDQQIDCKANMSNAIAASNVTISKQNIYDQCLSQSKIKALIAEGEIEAITIPTSIVTDIVLPSATPSGKSIVWTSSNADIVSTSGIVSLPKTATKVTLTATVAGADKTFEATVLPRDISHNVRASFAFDGKDKGITLQGSAKIKDGRLDLTANTASGFATNGYALVDEGLLGGLRSYTVILTANAKSLANSPRLYDFGGGSGNSVFLRANALSAGIKLNGGTTTMVNGATALLTDKEYKIAVTFDASTRTTKIYINGIEDVSGTANINEPYAVYDAAGDARNYIGRTQWWDGAYASSNVDFIGTIDNFVVYDIALTQKEVCDAQGIPFQEKEYPTTLTNPDFEATYSPLIGSGVSSDRAIYVPEGWDIDYALRNENDFTALKNGDLYYNQFFAPLTQSAEGGKQTLWIRQRWGDSDINMYQQIKPAKGKYTLTAQIYASDTSGKSYVYVGKTQRTATKSGTWQTVTFDIEADGDEVFNIGLRSLHGGTDAERICAFDNFTLTLVEDPIDDAIDAPSADRAPHIIYDLTGRCVTSTQRGVYIVNGKKVLK